MFLIMAYMYTIPKLAIPPTVLFCLLNCSLLKNLSGLNSKYFWILICSWHTASYWYDNRILCLLKISTCFLASKTHHCIYYCGCCWTLSIPICGIGIGRACASMMLPAWATTKPHASITSRIRIGYQANWLFEHLFQERWFQSSCMCIAIKIKKGLWMQ